jgi:Ca2+-binding EF-hand superfamily protein
VPLIALLVVLAPAPAEAQPSAPAAPAYASHRGGRMFISPMGEPFRPRDREDDSLADWFGQADRNHDGKLTLEEMQGDADRFFALLDANHDGEIDPDEISHYENVLAPEVTSGSSFGMMEGYGGEGGRGGPGGRRHAGFVRENNDQHQGAGRFGLLDLPEPVVSADTNFNRGVSQAEFRQAAAQRFIALDLDHHGYLTLPSLESIRPAPPAAPTKRKQPGQVDESALPDDPGY